jgi:hypothetical protein
VKRSICIWLGFAVLFALTMFPPWEILGRDGKLYPSTFPDGESVKDQMSRHFRIDRLPLWAFQDAIVVCVDYRKLLAELAVGECFVLALYLTWGRTRKLP